MTDRSQQLDRLAREFLDAFNRNDLDAVMAFFTDDAVYEEMNGRRDVGRDAIRAAFEPQFAGDHGRLTFNEDDTFVDAEAGKVMSSWTLEVATDSRTSTLRGLDLLVFDGDRITLKQTYAKAAKPLYVSGD
ncbi:MAG: nuclear transport factor 2 family protein [Gammaproteobacteria bacterium]